VEGGLWPTWLFVFAAKTLPWLILTLILIISLSVMYYLNKVKKEGEI
ncbi:PTS galactitol transporter subunit IIC, partial [Streptococcus agalactiae]